MEIKIIEDIYSCIFVYRSFDLFLLLGLAVRDLYLWPRLLPHNGVGSANWKLTQADRFEKLSQVGKQYRKYRSANNIINEQLFH